MKKIMRQYFSPLIILAAITIFVAACSTPVVQAQPLEPAAPKASTYQAVLGKSVNDKAVADFIASNYCSTDEQFALCPSLGLALWADSSQRIKMAYLYARESSFNAAYQGELPFSLTMRAWQQAHRCRFCVSPWKPQGFMTATSWKLAENASGPLARRSSQRITG